MAKRILIVDEDETSARELQSALELRHYQVERSASGEDALEMLKDTSFDLAIIDVELPRMSGLGVCERLRQAKPENMPHIILTSAFLRGAEEIRTIKGDTGARAFLPKPVELPQLHDLLIEALKLPAGSHTSEKLEGEISDDLLPKLLRRLSIINATGLLQVEREKVKKIIYIEGGYPIFVRSNLVKECLGQMLLRDNKIDKESFEKSLQMQKESKRLQGTILIELGLMTPHELTEALSWQISEKLLEVFSWKDGKYTFTPGRKFREGTTSIQQSPAALILQGIHRYWTRPQTREFLRPYQSQYLRQVENPLYRFQDIGLDRRGTDLLRECRGEKTLAKILQQNPLSATESEKTLAALLLSGMIEARQVAAPMDMDEPDLDGQKPSSSKLREQLLEDYSRMMQLDYFSLFDAPRDVSPEAIRKSYYQMAKHYHPDQLQGQGLSMDIHDKIKELFQYITKAYETLVDDKARAEYIDSLASGAPTRMDINKVMQAETAFQKGLVLLKANEFGRAAEMLDQAAKLSPEEPEYLTYSAWAQFKNDQSNADVREHCLQKLSYSRKINPKLDKTYLYQGYIYKQIGDAEKAQRHFEMALHCNPECNEAIRELRLQQMRQKKDGIGGVFGKMFGKS